MKNAKIENLSGNTFHKTVEKVLHLSRTFNRRWYKYWNRLKIRLLGGKLGKASTMWGKFYLHIGKDSSVTIGHHFALNSGNNYNPLCHNIYCSIDVRDGATLSIGDWSGISGGTISVSESITIGNHVNIGANCIIMDGDIHNTDWRLRHNDRQSLMPVPFMHRPIIIGDDVWLGVNSIVLKGVTIGARTIIGAGSVVTKDIPADCIAAGNPCKVIRFINSQGKNE